MNVTIKGIGTVGGFGTGIAALQRAMTDFNASPQTVTLDTSDGPIQVPALLADTADIQSYVDKRALRRIDHYVRMALLGSFLALEDAGLLDSRPDRMGIIVATGYGATCNTFDFQHSIIATGDPCGSPTKFSNSVHNAAAAHISIILRELGPNLSVSHFDMSIPSALVTAVQWLKEERVESVLVGGVDEFCKVLGYYWHCRYGQSEQPAQHTGQANSHRAIVGEGSCFFVLTREKEPTSAYGCIEDVQLGNVERGRVDVPDKSPVVLGADGFNPYDTRYAELLPGDCHALAYTPLYGSLPVGMAFDLAVAALTLESGKIYPPPTDSQPFLSDEQNSRNRQQMTTSRVGCLKLGAGNAFGLVTLQRN